MSATSRREQIAALLAADPNSSFLRYGLAMEYASASEDAEAVRHLRDLIERDPAYVPAYLQAGRALIRLGEDDEARTVLKTGITVATTQGDTHAAGEMTGFIESLDG